jgi:hypothetical protein
MVAYCFVVGGCGGWLVIVRAIGLWGLVVGYMLRGVLFLS